MRATFSYSFARILLFVVALGLLYWAGARGPLLVGLALVISGIVSFVVLSRLRDSMSGAITSRISRFRDRLDEGSRAEDDDAPPSAAEPFSAGRPASGVSRHQPGPTLIPEPPTAIPPR